MDPGNKEKLENKDKDKEAARHVSPFFFFISCESGGRHILVFVTSGSAYADPSTNKFL